MFDMSFQAEEGLVAYAHINTHTHTTNPPQPDTHTRALLAWPLSHGRPPSKIYEKSFVFNVYSTKYQKSFSILLCVVYKLENLPSIRHTHEHVSALARIDKQTTLNTPP